MPDDGRPNRAGTDERAGDMRLFAQQPRAIGASDSETYWFSQVKESIVVLPTVVPPRERFRS